MPLKQSVIDAFNVFSLTPDAEYAIAAKAYKKLALLNHPDKCPGDHTATERFQKIGAAWDICQKHYDNPARSEQTMYDFDDDDDDDFRDMEDEYFMWMFAQMMYDRFNARTRREYRSNRGRGPFPFFFGPPMGGYYGYRGTPSDSYSRSTSNSTRVKSSYNYGSGEGSNERSQQKEQEEFEKRVREFEEEIRQEEAEKARIAKEQQAAEDRITGAYVRAFKAGREGDGQLLREIVETNDLDVNRPEKAPKQKSGSASKKTSEAPKTFTSLLHVAAGACDVEAITFLKGRGADLGLLNPSKLSPFHMAISKGNAAVVKYFLYLKPTPDNSHPSKALDDGRTPLQLAISSGNIEVVNLMLKDAPVHDVERCWNSAENDEIRNVLLTKRGFQPPDECNVPEEDRHLSKKAQKKRAQAREEERLREEKAVRQAEEKARAEENRRKKEERMRKAKEREAEEARLQVEEEERRQAEARAQAEAEARQLAEIQAKEEAEAHARAEAEARAKEEEARLKVEAEARARAKAEAEAARQAKKRREERQEQKRKAQEQAKLKAKARKQEEAERTHNLQEPQKQEEEKAAIKRHEAEQAKQAQPEDSTKDTSHRRICTQFKRGHCRYGDKCRFLHEQPNEVTPQDSPPDPTPAPMAPVPASAPQKICSFFAQGKRCKFGVKCRDAHIKPDDTPVLPSEILPPSTPPQPAAGPVTNLEPVPKKSKPKPTEEQLRRRAEQSARDKAKARAKLEAKRTQTLMPTPSPTPPPPTPQSSKWETTISLSPPSSPEGAHTRALPDDLFPLEALDDTLGSSVIGLSPSQESSQEPAPAQTTRGKQRGRGYPWWRRKGQKAQAAST